MTTDAADHPNGASANTAHGHASSNVMKCQLDRALENAEYLLQYSAEAGIEVEPDVAQSIIIASRAGKEIWDGPAAGGTLAAITRLAAKVHPVTGETLRASQSKAHKQIRTYTWSAAILGCLIVPLSMISFITAGLSTSITADMVTANQLAVSLHNELDSPFNVAGRNPQLLPPVSALPDLQQFATTIRSIKDHTELLNVFLLGMTKSPFETNAQAGQDIRNPFEIDPKLNVTVQSLQDELGEKTSIYQHVRLWAKEVQDNIAIFYGSIAACLLPMLYSLLGACAYLLRLFSTELNSRTFSPSYAISARFFIALIGGMIVGLFGNISGTSLSPLALAFLVGYAADVFFSFLEGLLQNFRKPKAA